MHSVLRLLVLLPNLLLCSPSGAAELFQPVFNDKGLQVAEGQYAVLSGLDVPPEMRDAANAYLKQQSNLPDIVKALPDGATDRYGRFIIENQGLAKGLLNAGLAIVMNPAAVSSANILSELLVAEYQARQKKIGLWALPQYADIPADDAYNHIGRYGFVVGVVQDVVRVKSVIYLNFGDDWRKDFTAVIKAGDVKKSWPKSFDPQSYKGQHICVRGWLERRNGAMIAVETPWQIENLDK